MERPALYLLLLVVDTPRNSVDNNWELFYGVALTKIFKSDEKDIYPVGFKG